MDVSVDRSPVVDLLKYSFDSNATAEVLLEQLHASASRMPKFLIVAGPSGVGKGTLLGLLRKKYKGCFDFSVSHTTRNPRKGEVQGSDYFFIEDRKIICDSAAKGLFLEHSHIHGNVYGTSLAEVVRLREAQKVCLLEIDVKGTKQIKDGQFAPFCNAIFIEGPDQETLRYRLKKRATETEDEIEKRVAESVRECEDALSIAFDYRMVNDDFDRAFEELERCVIEWYPHLRNPSPEEGERIPSQAGG